MNASNNTKNAVTKSSLCENDDTKNQKKNSLSNDELSFIESARKHINYVILGSELFQVKCAMQHVETKILEHAIEDFFDAMIFRLISKGWNIAMINCLHENLYVDYWFKLQSYIFLKTEEHHGGSLAPYHTEAMIHSLKYLHIIDEFNAKTDLLLMPKITSIIFKVKELHHAMPLRSKKPKRQRIFDNIIEKAFRFLLIMIKNPQSCLAKSLQKHNLFTVTMCCKGKSGDKNEKNLNNTFFQVLMRKKVIILIENKWISPNRNFYN